MRWGLSIRKVFHPVSVAVLLVIFGPLAWGASPDFNDLKGKWLFVDSGNRTTWIFGPKGHFFGETSNSKIRFLGHQEGNYRLVRDVILVHTTMSWNKVGVKKTQLKVTDWSTKITWQSHNKFKTDQLFTFKRAK